MQLWQKHVIKNKNNKILDFRKKLIYTIKVKIFKSFEILLKLDNNILNNFMEGWLSGENALCGI